MTRSEIADRRRANRCQDVEWLLAAREHPERIAHRTGYANLNNLCDQLRRWGRADLADQLRGAGKVGAA